MEQQYGKIWRVFQQDLIPWTAEKGPENLIIARRSYDEMVEPENLPRGVSVTRAPLASKRVPVKGRKLFGRYALVDAKWPKDGLTSLRTMKVCFVLSGWVVFQVGDSVLHCKPGHGILIPPGTPHPDGSHTHLDNASLEDGNCDLFFMMPHSAGIECWISRTRQGHHWSHRAPDEACRIISQKASFYFDEIMEEITTLPPHSRQMSAALLSAVLTSLLREIESSTSVREHRDDPTIERSADPAVNDINRALRYMNTHLGDKLTIANVASHAYMSKTCFTTKFREITGKSFIEYVSDRRFSMAQSMLHDQASWPVERVASMVGLKPGRLRELFHEKVQMTPTTYRKQYLKNLKKGSKK